MNSVTAIGNADRTPDQPAVNSANIAIWGMTCASCVRRVEKSLLAVPGVVSASVNLATERAEVIYDKQTSPADLSAAIVGAGYQTGEEDIALAIEGMTCSSCVRRVEKALQAVPGVISASVNFATERADIKRIAGAGDVAALIGAIEQAGYSARLFEAAAPSDPQADRRAEESRALARDFAIAAALTLPVFILEMGSHFVPAIHEFVMGTIGMQESRILQFALVTLVLAWPGLRFYQKGIPSLLKGHPDMNSLVALGTLAAWTYSVISTFAPGLLPEGTVNVYYEAAAVIVTLVLLGRMLEARAKGRTSEAIRKLVGLQANTALVIRSGETVEVPIADVRVGDTLLVRPGERIAVDGEVVSGHSFVDESMISGEPIPVEKNGGAELIAGTINTSGALTYRATRIGADTLLAQIIRMVEQAQGAKLPIQSLVDRITAWFVPAVMVIAALTVLVWLIFGPDPALAFALVNGVAVLIIACPCAMGLATPVSIMVGTGRAAELGILFRKGDALQGLGEAAVVAFDKTGTLTNGKPELTDLVTANGYSRDEVLTLSASLEALSSHPIATAIVTAAKTEGLRLLAADRFENRAGFGALATVDGKAVAIGADRMMRELGIDVAVFGTEAARLGTQGKSPLYAAIDGKLAAIIAVADPIKKSAVPAIRALKANGIRLAMITGDNRRTAEAIASELGIDEVVAEVLPDGKVAAIERLQAGGRKVTFVGDGINDAPALAKADTGIAIGTGTDIAIESADLVLMSGELEGVSNAIALSKATMRNIRQNLFWAFAYNAVLIPVAAGVLYPAYGLLLSPAIGAGAMALSSVFVIGNALRLRRFRAA
ncbi:copper-translocating P-type ATPase [Rhizobium sp. KVB221]|uniref:P-type Cu(2+) transporter n=1 Tax=Rhizobium setariae TaxID=2801340 RepID=A0A936YS92_9HYPH|nr:heavy metal translocating P-type ATPase [Rhizobium setariae]MBL0373862.1 copper-translocating P-type ATPase [Rhizobium setariae]